MWEIDEREEDNILADDRAIFDTSTSRLEQSYEQNTEGTSDNVRE